MSKRPGLYFYRDAWDSEPGLTVVSDGAQLLWFKMLLLMNEQEPRGYLLLNGKNPTPKQIAAMARTDPSRVEECLAELEEAGVLSRDRRGVIYSRRMIREEKKARIARENGKKGGNPSLRKQREIPSSDNQGGKGGVIPLNSRLKTQALDSESHTEPETEEDSYLPPPESVTPREPEDGADAPGRGQEITLPFGVSVETINSLMPFYEMKNSRRGVERLVELLVMEVGSAAKVEGRLIEAISERKANPIQYVRKVLDNFDIKRSTEMETVKRREELGKPDPVMEADRITRQIISMGTSNDDDTPSYSGLTH